MNPQDKAQEIPRGAIKRFRQYLNDLPGLGNHRNVCMGKHYGQHKRSYGDYLYAQDREKFMADLRDWLDHGGPK